MRAGPVVVVGDALLDVDLRGVSHRDCPDAPAPVLEETEAWYRPGGAALAALCAGGSGREGPGALGPLIDAASLTRARPQR